MSTSATLDQAHILTLKGIGPALATKFEKIGLTTLQDVLFHLPIRYEDRTFISPIAVANLGEFLVIEGEVKSSSINFGRRRSLVVSIVDNTGQITLRFFHFSKPQQKMLSIGTKLRCIGEIRRGATGLEMYHPEYTTKLNPLENKLTPIYPVTEGISQNRIRAMVTQVLAMMDTGKILVNLGNQFTKLKSPNINDAISLVHNPPKGFELEKLEAGTHPAQKRLAFEELLAHHTSMRVIRESLQALEAHSFNPPNTLYAKLKSNLGFELTHAQNRVALEVETDMKRKAPMLRLIQGDVGSGKTVIAALAAIHACENHTQTALMAPTEILAEQHYLSFSNWLSPLGISCAWLSGKVKGRHREEQLALISSGEAKVIIGTHALFQKEVNFNRLGLVIIDEQHRFGVQQRLALREKGEHDGILPHQLVMTATPIPRTLTMSLYADMDASIIDELPPGRSPITTTVLADSKREAVITQLRQACGNGAQAYWVCTLIEESEVLQCQAAESTFAQLKEMLPDIPIGIVHGRMTAKEKSAVMSAFKQNEISLLVATTVIEVGVDVPNASLMVIENPERLGLAQLHQLRGRVGRGSTKSFCLLLYHPPLGQISKQRLSVMRESQDGFYIAEKDLEIRGPGELLGSRQSGAVEFKIADLFRDSHMLDDIRVLADELLLHDRKTAQLLMDRWLRQPEKLGQV